MGRKVAQIEIKATYVDFIEWLPTVGPVLYTYMTYVGVVISREKLNLRKVQIERFI
jgi:hypothetical protein